MAGQAVLLKVEGCPTQKAKAAPWDARRHHTRILPLFVRTDPAALPPRQVIAIDSRPYGTSTVLSLGATCTIGVPGYILERGVAFFVLKTGGESEGTIPGDWTNGPGRAT